MFFNVKWLPLFQENRLLAGEMILPVMMEPPPDTYSYITPDVLLPGTKWVDNHKGIFTVHLEAVTSVHTQVFPLLRYCQDRNVFVHFLLLLTEWELQLLWMIGSLVEQLRDALAVSGKEVQQNNVVFFLKLFFFKQN